MEHQLLEVASALFKALSKGYIFLSLPQFRNGLEPHFPIRSLLKRPTNWAWKPPAERWGLVLNFRCSSIHDAGGDRTKGLRGSGLVIPMATNLPYLSLLGMVNIPIIPPQKMLIWGWWFQWLRVYLINTWNFMLIEGDSLDCLILIHLVRYIFMWYSPLKILKRS